MSQRTKSNTIVHLLLDKIESGEYPHNGVLPPETELAAAFHAARNTVRKAIARLAERGIIIKSQGKMSRIYYPAAEKRSPTRHLAWLWYLPPSGMTCNTVYFEIFKLMVEMARDAGVGIQLFALNPNSDWPPSGLLDNVNCIGYFSVGATPFTVGAKLLAQLRAIPGLITIDETDDAPGARVVSIDNYNSGKLGAEHLIYECGCRNIVLLHTDAETNMPFQERIRGCRDVAANSGEPVVLRQVIMEKDQNSGRAAQIREQFLLENRDVDALFCLTDAMALDMLESARKLNLRIPQDLAILGFDGIYAGQHVVPRLTTIAQPNYEVVRAALRLALERNGQAAAPCTLKFTGRLIYGDTTRPGGGKRDSPAEPREASPEPGAVQFPKQI